MAITRKFLSKKTRFEVFKRDSFKCQYCGAASPDVVLVVDHIDPISKDGADEMFNYITACQPCNAGKSDRKLDDSTTLQKQRDQLHELSERREQLKMMLEWRNGLQDINESQVEAALDAWRQVVPGWGLTDTGMNELSKYIKKYGLNSVLDAFDTVKTSYIKYDEDGKVTQDSVNLGWSKVGGVLRMSNLSTDERDLYYIKGILRNRLSYVPYDVIKELQYAAKDGVSVDDMKLEAKHTRSWNAFRDWLLDARGDSRG